MDVKTGDYVYIDDRVIDTKVTQLLQQNKNKSAIRWDNYHSVIFEVIGFNSEGLAILRDVQQNEIHISKKALIVVPRQG